METWSRGKHILTLQIKINIALYTLLQILGVIVSIVQYNVTEHRFIAIEVLTLLIRIVFHATMLLLILKCFSAVAVYLAFISLTQSYVWWVGIQGLLYLIRETKIYISIALNLSFFVQLCFILHSLFLAFIYFYRKDIKRYRTEMKNKRRKTTSYGSSM